MTCGAAGGDGARLRSCVQHPHHTGHPTGRKSAGLDKLEHPGAPGHPCRPTAAPRTGGARRRTTGGLLEDIRVSELLTKIVPLALAAAVNPTGILVLMALLATARRAGLSLCIGFCVAFAAFGAVVLAFGLRLELRPSTATAVVDLVAAVLIAFLGVRALRRKPKPEDGHEKKRKLGLAGGFVAGLGLAVTDFSSIIPYLVALKEMAIAGVSAADAWVALVVFLAIMLAPMVAPTVLVFAAPAAADKVLGPVRRALQKHGDLIVAIVCFVIAVYLAEKGIRGL